MKGQAGLSDIEHRLAELSAEGDPLETLSATVDFEIFRAVLAKVNRPGFARLLAARMAGAPGAAGAVQANVRYQRWRGLGEGAATRHAHRSWPAHAPPARRAEARP